MKDYVVQLHIEGPNILGDLYVNGFATNQTAEEIGQVFAYALGEWKPGMDVTVSTTHEFQEDLHISGACECGKRRDHHSHQVK